LKVSLDLGSLYVSLCERKREGKEGRKKKRKKENLPAWSMSRAVSRLAIAD